MQFLDDFLDSRVIGLPCFPKQLPSFPLIALNKGVHCIFCQFPGRLIAMIAIWFACFRHFIALVRRSLFLGMVSS